MQFDDEFFGSSAQQTVSRRARNLWQLFPDDPRFSYNGRIMAVVGDCGPKTADIMTSLARVQGSTTCHFLPKGRVEALTETVEAAGLSSNIWEFCKGGRSAYDAAKNILEIHPMPGDITVERLTTDTTPSRVADFAKMATDCGVMVMSGRVMRGLDVPGITLGAFDPSGKAVASAWGYKCYSAQDRYSDCAFWGGLSCREDRRGQKLALTMGALSIVQLWEDLQVREFCTGIVAGNAASYAVCEKLGILPSDEVGMGVTDPDMFQGESLTK